MYAFILTKPRLSLFLLICNRVMAFDSSQNFVSAQYLENKLTEFCQTLCMHNLGCECYLSFFLFICNRVMSLDLYQNFVSAEYLENNWTRFDQNLYML